MFAIGIFLASVLFLHLFKKYPMYIIHSFFLFQTKTILLSLWGFINFFVLEILPFSLQKQA